MSQAQDKIEELENQITLKQLQINSLLLITQAVNINVPKDQLYKMFNDFLSWEMNVGKMAFFAKQGDSWHCESSIKIEPSEIPKNIEKHFLGFSGLTNVINHPNPFISSFNYAINISHKKHAIAYVLLGDISQSSDPYPQIQFITSIANIIAIALENKRLFKEKVESKILESELNFAQKMQKMLVPSKFPNSEHYEFDAIYQPKLEIGGDYYDVIPLENNRILFCIGDIQGKGVAAALLMANFQASLHGQIFRHKNLSSLVQNLNTSLFKVTKGEKFITFFIAVYDPKIKELTYINCGHQPPIYCDKKGIQYLSKGCTILGSFKYIKDIEVGKIMVEELSTIFTFTDGLSELINEENEFITQDIIELFIYENYNNTPKVINDLLKERLDKFRGLNEFQDDFTVLTAKLN